jgi:hypothetical protein
MYLSERNIKWHKIQAWDKIHLHTVSNPILNSWYCCFFFVHRYMPCGCCWGSVLSWDKKTKTAKYLAKIAVTFKRKIS